MVPLEVQINIFLKLKLQASTSQPPLMEIQVSHSLKQIEPKGIHRTVDFMSLVIRTEERRIRICHSNVIVDRKMLGT